jgi:hypothetical protein
MQRLSPRDQHNLIDAHADLPDYDGALGPMRRSIRETTLRDPRPTGFLRAADGA